MGEGEGWGGGEKGAIRYGEGGDVAVGETRAVVEGRIGVESVGGGGGVKDTLG